MANVSKMNKKQLMDHGKKLGIKLDDGMVKKTMVGLIKDAMATSTPAPKAKAKPKAKIVGKPPTPQPIQMPKKVVEDKSIWQKVKDFFGV